MQRLSLSPSFLISCMLLYILSNSNIISSSEAAPAGLRGTNRMAQLAMINNTPRVGLQINIGGQSEDEDDDDDASSFTSQRKKWNPSTSHRFDEYHDATNVHVVDERHLGETVVRAAVVDAYY